MLVLPNPLIKKKEPAVATKITGDPKNLVLPAKRRQEIASKYMQRLEEEARLRKEEEGEDDSPAAQAAKRSPEEQLEHEATVAAMRKEIASIALHREVLDKREQKLYKRLAEMGEEMEDLAVLGCERERGCVSEGLVSDGSRS